MEWYPLLSFVFALGVPAWLVVEEILRHRRARTTSHEVPARAQHVMAPAVPRRRAA